jgi:energy-coupling factor transporter ATP-binding protein EcfA2
MPALNQFTSLAFRNYKALRSYSVALRSFNILVGPNNSGKSTILGAFRILAEGIRKASSRNPEYLNIRGDESWGYKVPLDDLPVSTENVFSDYDDSYPAVVEFRLSGGNKLELRFPEPNVCYLICRPKGRPIRTTGDFKREYRASVGFVPILGPVEHDEMLYQKEAARRALLTHRASRNFRNIWYYYPDEFDEFRNLIRATWPGMDIQRPEVESHGGKPLLRMFCPEERFPREIYWAGFGFQVWCQMLTFIVRSKKDSLLIIDEPDIYLHSDLQRQLIALLRELPADVLLATHSTEIISEADPGDLLVINKKAASARRIKDPAQLQTVFGALGSNLNPTLTQLAKSRRALFVEGRDFQILGAFARRLTKTAVANRTDFAVILSEGFNPAKVKDLGEGMEMTLGAKVLKAVIFDRDFRSEPEVIEVSSYLLKFAALVRIHSRKELENYLLEPGPIDRAIHKQIDEHNRRSDEKVHYVETADALLSSLSDSMKQRVGAQFLAKRTQFEKAKHPAHDYATINERLLNEFETQWASWDSRKLIVPGKELLAELNKHLQSRYHVSVTSLGIATCMEPSDISDEIQELIEAIDRFGHQTIE